MNIQCTQCGKPQEYDGSGLCSWRSCAETGSCDGTQIIRASEVFDELQRFGMSAGMAHQYRAEAKAARECLGFNPDSEDVAPIHLTHRIFDMKQALQLAEDILERQGTYAAEGATALTCIRDALRSIAP